MCVFQNHKAKRSFVMCVYLRRWKIISRLTSHGLTNNKINQYNIVDSIVFSKKIIAGVFFILLRENVGKSWGLLSTASTPMGIKIKFCFVFFDRCFWP